MTAACLREMLPSLIGRSDDFDPRPMMNWSLSMRYFWLSKTRYSGGAAVPAGVPAGVPSKPEGGGGGVMPICPRPPGPGMGRPKRPPAGGMGGGGGAHGPAAVGGRPAAGGG